jgi:hypothetical protein
MKQESSFANNSNNPTVDDRNIANPFSVHFTHPKNWPDGCKKNALLKPDKGSTYTPPGTSQKHCVAHDHRLPTFAESAAAAAAAVRKNGLESSWPAVG